MVEKTISVGEKVVKLKSSGAVPRMYRIKFGRDIFLDMLKLQEAYVANVDHQEASHMSVEELTIFENVAYIMALHADPSVPDSIDEWLEGFEILSIYDVLPHVLELWKINNVSIAEAKKNAPQPSDK